MVMHDVVIGIGLNLYWVFEFVCGVNESDW